MIKIVEIQLIYHNQIKTVKIKFMYYNQAIINIITLE